MSMLAERLDLDKDLNNNDRIKLMSLKPCACGHSRRVHTRKKGYDGHVTEYGKCLGGTDRAPMSCECPKFGE